ncbi:MAG: FAD-dependent oxidoreductase [Candidatus Binatia bacterium]
MTTSSCQVAVVGAGPYGLAATAYLRAAGVETRIFGEPMEFWQRQMPKGMLLRSSWEASHIAAPHQALTLDEYQVAQGARLARPVPLSDFVAYGQWFQQQVADDVDRRKVARIESTPQGFQLTLSDGESLRAQRVVVATGLTSFAHCPPQFGALPPALASHASDHADLACFAGKKVVVVGSGQSAIESAALLSEGGAEVEVLARAPKIRWLRRSAWLHSERNPIRRLLYPPTDVGPPVLNWLVAMPNVFKQLPRNLQDRIAYRSIRPAASGWLFPRTRTVRITTNCEVVSTVPSGERLCLTLEDGTKRDVDHALLATGYRINASRYGFLAPELVSSLQCVDGYPRLTTGFEASVPGLHFLGAASAWSFGPLMRFVAGTGYSASTLTRFVLGKVPKGVESKEQAWPAMSRSQQIG